MAFRRSSVRATLPCESGFGYSRECVQFVAVCGKHVGRDHSDTGQIETTRNGCTGRPAAAKAGSHRIIQALLKRLNIVVIVLEPYVSDVFRVPKPFF